MSVELTRIKTLLGDLEEEQRVEAVGQSLSAGSLAAASSYDNIFTYHMV